MIGVLKKSYSVLGIKTESILIRQMACRIYYSSSLEWDIYPMSLPGRRWDKRDGDWHIFEISYWPNIYGYRICVHYQIFLFHSFLLYIWENKKATGKDSEIPTLLQPQLGISLRRVHSIVNMLLFNWYIKKN